MQSDRSSTDRLVAALYLSAAITLVAAVVLGVLVSPALFAIALVALVDVVLARLFARGVIGPPAARRRAEHSGDAAILAEADAGYNPYARED